MRLSIPAKLRDGIFALLSLSLGDTMRLGIRTYFRDLTLSSGLVGAVIRFLLGKRLPVHVDHLQGISEEDAIGPIQRSEALLLFALVQVLRPRVIVEFGFAFGDSAINFLKAGDLEMMVYSYDVNPGVRSCADQIAKSAPNFRFYLKSQAEFCAADVDNQLIDLVFMDAAHDLALNQATWSRLVPSLRPEAVVVVHDTGAWAREKFRPISQWYVDSQPGHWLTSNQYLHQPEERRFVNWVVEQYSGFAGLHLHSLNVLRHGMTILHRSGTLPVEPLGLAGQPQKLNGQPKSSASGEGELKGTDVAY